MSKIKDIFLKWRVIVLLFFLVASYVAINPQFDVEGVAIRNVLKNSSMEDAGITSPKPTIQPTRREVVLALNNIPTPTMAAYDKAVATLEANQTYSIQTNQRRYTFKTRLGMVMIPTNETEERIIEVEENGTLVNKTTTVPKKIIRYEGMEDIGLRVFTAPSTNLRKGLDIQGGTRVLLQPATVVSDDDMEILLESLKQRLNVFGLSDIVVRPASDLTGNQYILVEIAGANEEEVRELIVKQGKFEAKIGNATVFRGGRDITYVCRSADCSGIDPQRGCGQNGEAWVCQFRFSISLTPAAAQRQADATRNLKIVSDGGGAYLEKQIDFFLDDEHVDALNIGAELRGRAITDIQISGSGSGMSQQDASFDTLQQMKRLQTILITGSLPVKLNVVKTDQISPVLGEEFLNNTLYACFMALIAVALVIFLCYRKLTIVIPMLFTAFSEIVLLLGFAALVGWNIDLAAIAGIIVAIGTGLDDLIVITSETVRGDEESYTHNWKRKLKQAMFIIMGAYFTTLFAMGPLLFAGAGLVKGFALITIAGITFGVFVSRPAYAAILEVLLRD